ncbi:MAG: cytochrome B [Gammaproteobacteria bacterium]|nr:MAG: cytochrome B [Gammaproteobacteria bacterium]
MTGTHKKITIKVWDRFVRGHHWGLVGLFATAYLSGSYGWGLTHEWAGYTLCVFLLARILWGFIGSEHARFKNFLFSPKTKWHFLRNHLRGKHVPVRYVGHNPAGGAMVFLLIATLLMLLMTGLATLATTDFWGPLWPFLRDVNDSLARQIRQWHEWLANGILVLVGLHLAGVVFTSLIHKENLVRAMITGKKTIRIHNNQEEGIHT